MTKPKLYPEGVNMTVYVPEPVKHGLQIMAGRQRQSVSQLVTVVLEDYLRRRGELRYSEPQEVSA